MDPRPDNWRDSCGVALRVLQTDKVSGQREQSDGKARRTDRVQGNHDKELEGVGEEVRELIEAQLLSANPIIITKSRGTALHRAAERGLAGVVGRLLAVCPALIDMVEQHGTALHYAALNGHADVVAQLVAVSPALVDARAPSSDWNALHCAVARGHAAIAMQLLAMKPSLIDARAIGKNILYCAAKHPAIMSQLLALKPTLIDDDDNLLHQAVSSGQPEAVAQLLALKPSLVDVVMYGGQTVLHRATRNSVCEPATVAHLLAAKPALIDARDDEGLTALHHAVKVGHSEIVSQLLSISPTLIEAKADNGRSALHFAVSARRDEITAQVFAAHPAPLEDMINDADCWTALKYVVGLGHEEAVGRLLAMHPELIRGTSDCGWTVFHYAARYDREKVVAQVISQLLAAGVSQAELEQILRRRTTKDEFAPNWDEGAPAGSTALYVASSRSHVNTIMQLLAACPTLIDDDRPCLHADEPTMKYLIDFKPALVHAVDDRGNTIHNLLWRGNHTYSLEFIERVWKMNPQALRAVNCVGRTPFFYAVRSLEASFFKPFDPAERAQSLSRVELLQGSLTFDEIVSTHVDCGTELYVARLKPLMKRQCEELARVLLPDVVTMVFDYLELNKLWGTTRY